MGQILILMNTNANFLSEDTERNCPVHTEFIVGFSKRSDTSNVSKWRAFTTLFCITLARPPLPHKFSQVEDVLTLEGVKK